MGIDKFLFSDPTTGLLRRSLDVHLKRLEAVSANLANLDTPGYKAIKVDFKKSLATEVRRAHPELPAATQAGHIGYVDPTVTTRSLEFVERDDDSGRVDGNTVDLDREMTELAHAQLQYSASIAALSRKMAILTQALSDKI
ncbi:MAG: flagellar basal body rod protein FlgB [Deltaproteobacteria bacterium]|nr:flagellar basal body rod protein FlgB [Deltaproteobacteria bacterium]